MWVGTPKMKSGYHRTTPMRISLPFGPKEGLYSPVHQEGSTLGHILFNLFSFFVFRLYF